MRRAKNKMMDRHGTTVVELTVAVAIMATVFVAIMPLFAGIRNSADARWANLEMLQNARVLNDHLCRCLAGARRIIAAGTGAGDDGYIEFEAADGVVFRCALGADGYVEYGPVRDPGELAGPVDYLRFVCYDGNDADHPAARPERIRLVTWEAGLRSMGTLARDRILQGACYLRVAGGMASDTASNPPATDSVQDDTALSGAGAITP